MIKFFNREAVATQSPGLPRLGGYPGKDGQDQTPTGLRPYLTLHTETAGDEKPAQPLRGWKPRIDLFPKVAAKARQPWALGRNRFAVKTVNQRFLKFVGRCRL